MRFRVTDLAARIGGRVVGPDLEIDGATIDSRDVPSGAMFVPVLAERDGHDFLDDALAAGARASLTSRDPERDHAGVLARGATLIAVDDTERALRAWGAAARERLPDRVVGITGSVGKTTTKDLAAGALRAAFRTHASPRSFNNELGVPLTLCNASDDTDVAVVEMGARGIGHIAWLCETVRPTIAVVTAVELVHTELFGSLDDVAQGKGELVEALPSQGTAILNAANPRVMAMAARTAASVLTFGAAGADVVAENVVLDNELRPRFVVRSPWGSADVLLGVRGAHNVGNALAALAVAGVAGVPLTDAVAGIAAAPLSRWRMELVRSPSGALILNDAYNAGPASMRAALDALAALDVGRRFAVLGVMAELGEGAENEHRLLVAHAVATGSAVIAVNAPAYGADALHVSSIDDVPDVLGALGYGDAVLVKGSRVAGLERLAELLSSM